MSDKNKFTLPTAEDKIDRKIEEVESVGPFESPSYFNMEDGLPLSLEKHIESLIRLYNKFFSMDTEKTLKLTFVETAGEQDGTE